MSLLAEYKDAGIEQSELEGIEALEEMELYCEQKTTASLREKLAEMEKTPETVPTEPAPTAPATPVAQPNVPGVPAAATAPSDVGAEGTSPEGKTFSEEKTPDALYDNLKNMEWSTPRVKQG